MTGDILTWPLRVNPDYEGTDASVDCGLCGGVVYESPFHTGWGPRPVVSLDQLGDLLGRHALRCPGEPS